MKRLPDWEERLTAVLAKSFDRKFEWGQFDCCLFVCECIEAMTGVDLSMGLRGTYSDKIGAHLAIKRISGGDLGALAQMMAAMFEIEEIQTALACPGDIALMNGLGGLSLGVCVGEKVLSPSYVPGEGLAHDEIENCLRAWKIRHAIDDLLANGRPENGTILNCPATLITLVVSIVLSFAMQVIQGGLTKAFGKKKKNPLTGEGRTVTIRQPVSPWQILYGSARVGGTVFFLERDSPDVWLGVVWAAHECKAIDSIYTDDTQNFIADTGEVVASGTNTGKLFVYNHLGDPDQTYDTTLAAAFPLLWTSDHRLRGRCYSIIRFVDLATNWNDTVPNVSADIRGKLITDSRTGTEVFTDNAGQCIRDFLQNGDFGFDCESRELDAANFNSESNICDQEVEVPNWSEHFTIDAVATDTVTFNTGTDVAILAVKVGTDYGANGSGVIFSTTGALPSSTPQIVAGTTYYKNGSGSNLSIHTTVADAIAGTNRINFTTAGSPTTTMFTPSPKFTMLGRETAFTANTAADTITTTLLLGNGSETAASTNVVVVMDTTATMPAPLIAGTRYEGSSAAPSATFQLSTYPTDDCGDWHTHLATARGV
jgi:hypothetical protein